MREIMQIGSQVGPYLRKSLDVRTPMNRDELVAHMLSTYWQLRLGMGLLALLMPLVLIGWGWWHGVAWQPSMSDYFFALPDAYPSTRACSLPLVAPQFSFPVRGAFVGGLCAIGFCLFLYKGFSRGENILLNFAAIFAAGVAFIPMSNACFNGAGFLVDLRLHYVSAVLLFLCMALTVWTCAGATLCHVPDPARREGYARWYKRYAIGMALFPVVAIAVSYLLPQWLERRVFVVEAFGVLVFATYWLTKSHELYVSSGETRMMCGPGPDRPGA